MARRRMALVAVSVAALLAAAALLATFDAPVLGRAALARIASAMGARASAREFRFQLVRGLKLEGLDAASEFNGGRWTLAADALVLDHRFWPLLAGRVEVDRVVLRRPRIRFEQRGPAGPAAPTAAGSSLAALALHVVEARIEGGTVELIAPGQPPLAIGGLDVALRELGLAGATLSGLRGSGTARARAVRFGRTEARDVEGRFALSAGQLTADEVRFRTGQGAFRTALRARLDRLPLTYALDLRGDPLDLNAMAGQGPAGGLGPATLELSATGTSAGTAALRGQGVLRMQPGRLPGAPLLQRVQAAIGLGTLVGARYEAATTPFRLQDGRASFDSFALRADPLQMQANGWISLDGPLSLAVRVTAPRAGLRVPGVPDGVLDTLADDQGRVVIPLTVTGTQTSPVVRPDAGALLAQAGHGAGRSVLGKAAEGLKGLFRRK